MNGNIVTTAVYNSGTISSFGVDHNVYDFAWKGLGYAYEIGLMVGAKVPSATSGDSVKIISEGFGNSYFFTTEGDFSPDGSTKWGFLPTSGYAMPNQNIIANNQDPMTWPTQWITWSGKNGNAMADLEIFYGMNDFSNTEFDYFPFFSDSSKRGLGLHVDARYYQFNHPQLEDMFFTTFDIINTSEKSLPEIIAGIFGDPHIGGSGNFGDDATNIDKIRKLIYSWDPDNVSDIPNIPPGYFGTVFTETPNNIGLTSYAAVPFGGLNRPKQDAVMYDYLKPGFYTPENFYPPEQNIGDYVMIAGSGYSPLSIHSTISLGIAYIFADDKEDLFAKSDRLETIYSILFSNKTGSLTITNPTEGQTIQSNSIQILWNSSTLSGDSTITILYSNKYGATWWNEIVRNAPNTGFFEWNTSNIPDGIFYKIYIANNSNVSTAFDSTKGFFKVNKLGDVPPEIAILHPVKKRYSGMIPISWIAGDADGDPVSIKILFSENNGGTYSLLTQTINSGSYNFDTRSVANTVSAKLKIEATSNNTTVATESVPFLIANFSWQ